MIPSADQPRQAHEEQAEADRADSDCGRPLLRRCDVQRVLEGRVREHRQAAEPPQHPGDCAHWSAPGRLDDGEQQRHDDRRRCEQQRQITAHGLRRADEKSHIGPPWVSCRAWQPQRNPGVVRIQSRAGRD